MVYLDKLWSILKILNSLHGWFMANLNVFLTCLGVSVCAHTACVCQAVSCAAFLLIMNPLILAFGAAVCYPPVSVNIRARISKMSDKEHENCILRDWFVCVFCGWAT